MCLIPAALTVANLAATTCLMRSNIFTRTQKALQLMLVWVVPLLGATFVLSVWAHDRKSAPRDPIRPGEPSAGLPGIDSMSDHSHPTSIFGDVSSIDGRDGDGGGHSN